MQPYYTLFTAISKSIEALQAAQQKAEEQITHSGLYLFENTELVEFGIVRADTAEQALQILKYPEYRVIEIPADAVLFSNTDRENQWIAKEAGG